MDDLISRQAAIDTLAIDAELLKRVLDNVDIVGNEREKYEWGLGLIEAHIADMKDLPSAQPERKMGRWIYEGKRGRFPACRCSECGNVENADWAILGDNVNYCPNCGANMKGEKK